MKKLILLVAMAAIILPCGAQTPQEARQQAIQEVLAACIKVHKNDTQMRQLCAWVAENAHQAVRSVSPETTAGLRKHAKALIREQ